MFLSELIDLAQARLEMLRYKANRARATIKVDASHSRKVAIYFFIASPSVPVIACMGVILLRPKNSRRRSVIFNIARLLFTIDCCASVRLDIVPVRRPSFV